MLHNLVLFLTFVTLSTSVFFNTTAAAYSAQQEEQQKIDFLVKSIKESDARFIRNGFGYSAERAYDHIEYKRDMAGDKIRTARQFIEHLASRSYLTGRPYYVEFPDGTRMTSRSWFMQRLYKIEGEVFTPFFELPADYRS